MSEFRAPAPRIELGSNGASGSAGNGRSETLPAPTARPAPSLPSPSGRGSGLTLIGTAAVLGAGALALGGWAFVRQHRTTTPMQTKPVRVDTAAPLRRAVRLLASPRSERLPLARSAGRLVVVLDEHGSGVLVVRNLGRAPAGLAYEAWVAPRGARPAPAALFAGGAEQVVSLRGRVDHGARVAVTLERLAGAQAPTRRLRLVARRP